MNVSHCGEFMVVYSLFTVVIYEGATMGMPAYLFVSRVFEKTSIQIKKDIDYF